MKADYSIGIIGGGSMGSAIASGLVGSGSFAPERVCVCDHHADKLADLAQSLKIATYATADELIATEPDVVILAIKPQVMLDFVQTHASELTHALVISIAAGIPLATYEALMSEAHVIRAMPNLPIKVRSGATAIAAGTLATPDEVAVAEELFGVLGVARVMREDQLDVAGQDSGLAPAVFALVIDAMTRAGIRKGMPAAACREMLEATMLGTAGMLIESGEHPRAYMERITSPGGTTIAFLQAAEPGIVSGVEAGIDAAMQRNAELGAPKDGRA